MVSESSLLICVVFSIDEMVVGFWRLISIRDVGDVDCVNSDTAAGAMLRLGISGNIWVGVWCVQSNNCELRTRGEGWWREAKRHAPFMWEKAQWHDK